MVQEPREPQPSLYESGERIGRAFALLRDAIVELGRGVEAGLEAGLEEWEEPRSRVRTWALRVGIACSALVCCGLLASYVVWLVGA
jgi:hypothetical protein